MRILVIEPIGGDIQSLQAVFAQNGLDFLVLPGRSTAEQSAKENPLQLDTCSSLEEGLEYLKKPYDVVMVDAALTKGEIAGALAQLRTASDQTPLVVLMGEESEAIRAAARMNGAETAVRGDGDDLQRILRFARDRNSLLNLGETLSGVDLSDAEERYRELANMISDYSYSGRIDDSGKLIVDFASGRFDQITGYTVRELMEVGSWSHICLPEDHEILKQHREDFYQGKAVVSEIRIINRSGRLRWLRHYSRALLNESGVPYTFFAVGQDITQRKRAEMLQSVLFEISENSATVESLDQLYVKVHAAIDRLIDARNFYIALYNEESNLIEFPYFCDENDTQPAPITMGDSLTGYVIRTGEPLLTFPEVALQLVKDGLVGSHGTAAVDWLGVPMFTGDQVLGALVVQTYEPGVRYSEDDLNLMNFVAEQVSRAIERKRTENALRENEERFRSLVENLSIGVLRNTPGAEGHFLMANQAFLSMVGYSSFEELQKATMADLYVHREQRKEFSDRLIRSGRLVGNETLLKRRDGTHLWGAVSSHVVRDPVTGEALYFDTTFEDITERKQREIERDAIVALASAMRNVQTRADTLKVILDHLMLLMKADAAVALSLDPSNQEIVVDRVAGNVRNVEGSRLSADESSMAVRMLMAGMPFLSNDPKSINTLHRGNLLVGFRSVATVPLVVQGIAIGMLGVGCSNEINSSDFRMMCAIADLAANSIHRTTLFEETQRRLQRLTSLRAINTAISASLDLRVTLKVLVDQITTQLQADAADVLLLNPFTFLLEYAAGQGFHQKHHERARVRLGQGMAGMAAMERRTVQLPDLTREPPASNLPDWFSTEGIQAYFVVPLIVKGEIKGVLETFHRKPHPSDPEWLEFLESVAGQAAIAIDNAELLEKLQFSNDELTLAYDATIESWASSLDRRDHSADGHSRRLAELCLRLANRMGIPDPELVNMRRGALLHDVGMVTIPDTVLNKPGELTPEEWDLIRQHPWNAYRMLSPISYLRNALDIPYCHQERWNGSGYPRGLAGEQIPFPARIFAVVDVFDALTSPRPQRDAWEPAVAFEYIERNAGILFDPAVVEVFLRMLRDTENPYFN